MKTSRRAVEPGTDVFIEKDLHLRTYEEQIGLGSEENHSVYR